jgi:hypothetical protein
VPQFTFASLKFISDTKWLSLITETYLEGLDAHRGFSSHLASDEITTRGYRVLSFTKCTTIMIVVLAVTSGLGSSFD